MKPEIKRLDAQGTGLISLSPATFVYFPSVIKKHCTLKKHEGFGLSFAITHHYKTQPFGNQTDLQVSNMSFQSTRQREPPL